MAAIILTAAGLILIASLSEKEPDSSPLPSAKTVPTKTIRAYRMGFSLILPPLPNFKRVEERLNIWSKHADGSIIHDDMPWAKLLGAASIEAVVKENILKQAELLRSKGLRVIVTVEPLNGIDRAAEARELVAAGRSIKEPAIQKIYQDYVLAVAALVKPDYLGLAAEVNLFKSLGPRDIYQALVGMVNETATEVGKKYPNLPLYVSAQVEEAWGKSGRPDKRSYVGVNDVFSEYPFIDILGLSTYPLLGWNNPGEIPENYFSRLTEGRQVPVVVVESGWSSKFGPKKTSLQTQAEWIAKLAKLADKADTKFVGQLLVSDFDQSIPVDSEILEFFAFMGLWDANFKPKPALQEWDAIFTRAYKP